MRMVDQPEKLMMLKVKENNNKLLNHPLHEGDFS